MKIIFIIIIVMVGLFTIFQIYLAMADVVTESQKYEVVHTGRGFEIRFYPAATMAVIKTQDKSYKELGGSSFGKLANYIFGGNEAKQQIAMTSPVHMDINDSESSMSFVMPTEYSKENLPIPNDSEITIKKTQDEYVAVIKFSGFASEEDIRSYAERLEKLLKDNSISYNGNFRFLGYNSPYQIFGRRNEIVVSVTWDSK